MISKYNHKELNWVKLDSPSEDELSHIFDLYSIPQYIKDNLKTLQKEDKIDISYDYTFISIGNNTAQIKNKIIFILHDNFIISIHYTPLSGFDKFSKEIELDITGDQRINNNRLLFAHLLKNLYLGSEEQSLLKDIEIKNLKNKLFRQQKKFQLLSQVSFIFIIITIIIIIYVISII